MTAPARPAEPRGEDADGGPAFPTDSPAQVGNTTWHFAGMSLRDYFAASALQGIIASPSRHTNQDGTLMDKPNDVAAVAYIYADAMIEARK